MSRLIALLLILAAGIVYWRQQAVEVRRQQASTASAPLAAPAPAPAPGNRLALGAAAKLELVDLQVLASAELDRLSKADVLRLRRQAVMTQAPLLAADYVPSEAVFGQIVDGAPWWGIEGQFRHGPGPRSIEGPSEESRFILNPFLLVAPEFGGFWPRLNDAEARDFPFTCYPHSLVWWPREARAEASYSAACIGLRL